VDGTRQLEDLVREREQLLVLLILLLHGLPLLIGEHLTLRVRSVLTDHHERREEDRLERDDHRQQPERVMLDAEPDPAAEPKDVQVDELHRSRKRRDLVCDPVLHAFGTLLGVREQRRVRLELHLTEPVVQRLLVRSQCLNTRQRCGP
jgi:hypothetical protein